MNKLSITVNLIAYLLIISFAHAQNSKKIKNYLPHMTSPEVKELLARTDMVIIPIAALEQHGNHLPIGTDFLNAVESSIQIAQIKDVLVAPILMAGQSDLP